jgi:hypothetical protein
MVKKRREFLPPEFQGRILGLFSIGSILCADNSLVLINTTIYMPNEEKILDLV